LNKKLIRKSIVIIIIFLLIGTSITITTSSSINNLELNVKNSSNIYRINEKMGRDTWWDTDWNHYKMITIESNFIDSDLANFPILVNSTNSVLISKCDNGNSIRFLSLDNITEFNYEIEKWTSTGFSIWVNISETITSLTDYNFLMYYNNSDAIDNQSPENVWDSDYSVVLHMDETSGIVYDSTSYNNNANIENSVEQDAIGKIDGADNFDGESGHLAIVDDSSLDLGSDGTVEAWFNWDVEKFSGGIVHKGDKADWSDESYSLQGWARQNRIAGGLIGTSTIVLTSPTDGVQTGVWYYAVLTWGTFGAKLYINTTEEDSVSTTTTVYDTSGHINIGTQLNETHPTYGYFPLDGTIDEVRISQTARSSSWLKACFHTQNQTSGFLTFGPEQTKPAENIPPIIEITNPKEGESVFGEVTITGTSDDTDGNVEHVEVRINNENWNTASGTNSWTYEWDTTEYSDGDHSIYSRSYDGEDYSTIYQVNVTVDNGVDNIPPTVEIDTPHYGCIYFTIAGNLYCYIPSIPFITLIIGKIYIIVNASDNVGIESVKFYIDDILRHTDTEPPYIWLWDERTMLFTYEVKVVARDYRGNEATDSEKVWRLQIRQPEG
jgi:hypothetical protein